MGKNFDNAFQSATPLIRRHLGLIAPEWEKDSSQEPHHADLLIIARDSAIKQGELQGSIKLTRNISSKGTKNICFYRPS